MSDNDGSWIQERKISMRFSKAGSTYGLVLSGGAARGLAHIGVLDRLYRARIPVDLVIGTSAGAIFGALYAAGIEPAKMRRIVLAKLRWLHFVSLVDVTLPKSGLIGGKKLIRILRELLGGDLDFQDLQKPFACVAVDIDSGEEVVMREGSVLEAIRASISIPGIFSPVRWNGHYLVDGGILNNLPVDVARNMGADFVIAINVFPERTPYPTLNHGDGMAHTVAQSMMQVLAQSYHIAASERMEHCEKLADMIIRPRVSYMGPEEFGRAREFMVQGEIAAEAVLPDLLSRLRIHRLIHYPRTRVPGPRPVASPLGKKSGTCGGYVIVSK
jgi:NTE family protein